MEHIIYSNLLEHLNANNFFMPTQHGFREGFSCDKQPIDLYHDIASSVDAGAQANRAFFDFE